MKKFDVGKLELSELISDLPSYQKEAISGMMAEGLSPEDVGSGKSVLQQMPPLGQCRLGQICLVI